MTEGPMPEAQPVYWQYRRFGEEWHLGQMNGTRIFADNPHMEVRPLYAGPVLNAFDPNLRVQQIEDQVAALEEKREALLAEAAKLVGVKP